MIEVYVLVYNEERMIPYIIRHYSQFARIIFIDNNSTDGTRELIKGFEVQRYNIPDNINDIELIKIKEACWKNSHAEWVMVVDADEFIYHPDITNILKNSKATVIYPKFYNMFSDVFPTTKGQIYDEVVMGTDGGIWLNKMNIFRPDKIICMDWAVGCHYAYPKGDVIIDDKTEIKTLHMKFMGREYVINRHKKFSARVSEVNRKNNWALHYDWDENEINAIFDNTKLRRII